MNTITKIVFGLFAGVTFIGTPSEAQVTKQGDRYLLRMKFTPGQTIRYTMRITQTVGAAVYVGLT